MKLIVGFFMAWGNFVSLPCPYKRWDSKLKNVMLAFLPLVGAIIGALWLLLLWVLGKLCVPAELQAFAMELYIFAICGFIHMDGFMDCNDAILSRRDLPERQRILKDSNVGAFAVITVIFLLLAWYAAVQQALYADMVALCVLPIISRSLAGLYIMIYKPIGHSQYVSDFSESGKGKCCAALVLELIILIILAFFFAASVRNLTIFIGVEVVSSFCACLYARRQLGGMSGDVAGYTICVSEVCGVLALAII